GTTLAHDPTRGAARGPGRGTAHRRTGQGGGRHPRRESPNPFLPHCFVDRGQTTAVGGRSPVRPRDRPPGPPCPRPGLGVAPVGPTSRTHRPDPPTFEHHAHRYGPGPAVPALPRRTSPVHPTSGLAPARPVVGPHDRRPSPGPLRVGASTDRRQGRHGSGVVGVLPHLGLSTRPRPPGPRRSSSDLPVSPGPAQDRGIGGRGPGTGLGVGPLA